MGSRNKWIAILLVVGLVVFLCSLFAVQNWSRTATLSIDLYFKAFQLKDPVPIPALIGGCTLGGFLVGYVFMGVRSWGQARKIRQLQQSAALNQEPGDAW